MDGEDAGRHSISMRALIRSELSECKDSRETDWLLEMTTYDPLRSPTILETLPPPTLLKSVSGVPGLEVDY